jgi:ribonuclease R
MDFSIATLLANFTDDKSVAPKILEKKLGCQDEKSTRYLQIALDALEKIGVLVKEKGRYRRVWEESLVEAKLRCSSKGFCFAIQDTEGTEDIYIRECHLSNAWNGDRVLVNIIKEGSRRRSPEGEVKLILERANPSVLARVKQTGNRYLAVPLDDRLLFELDLKQNGVSLADAVEHLVHVEVLRYALGRNPPLGRVAQILGSDAEDANDLDIVCCKHDLPRAFPQVVLDAIADLPKPLRKAEIKGRLDLRSLQTIALMPASRLRSSIPTVEQAFSLETLKSGEWRLSIHVSDVAHYVKPDTALDREARRRSVSAHLGDMVLPIIPEQLALDSCSLLTGEDRLAVSVLVILDDDGVVDFEIKPSVIKVDYQVSDRQAQPILDKLQEKYLDPEIIPPWWVEFREGQKSLEEPDPLPPAIAQTLEKMFHLSYAMQNWRRARGGFDLNLPPNQYGICPSVYNDEGAEGAISLSSHINAQGMLCEFTILANQLVATHLQQLGVPGIYRVQAAPDLEQVDDLIKLASNMGVEVLLDDPEEVTPIDFQDFTEVFAASGCERVLTYLLEDTLKPASYSTTAGPHFGLALNTGYTHFCSPVQRYADLLVQRLLKTVFEEGRDRKSARSKEYVDLHSSHSHGEISWNVLPPTTHSEFESHFTTIVGHLSDREKLTQEAEADLQGLKKAGLMKARTGETFSGLITGVQSYGFFVEIEVEGPEGIPLRLEGLVHVSSLKDDWYEYRSRLQTLVGRKNRKQYSLGDIVEVQVKSVDYYRQQIDLVAVGGGSEASGEDYTEYRDRERNYYDYEEDI